MVFDTQIPRQPDTALREFVELSEAEKAPYLQDRFDQGFDGYSYWGQSDSKNQYDTDMLHSFVISEFTPPERFPAGFQRFFETDWADLRKTVREVEREIIATLDVPGLDELYEESIGHMVSCNYYPKTQGTRQTARGNTRLSRHKDVSLLTTFVFGLDAGMSYVDAEGAVQEMGQKPHVLSFPGYLMEVLSAGRVPALEHQVDLPEDALSERFSFAFFSVPRPGSEMRLPGLELSAEAYHARYLSLF
ncbi:2OG-Fe(II) oxygenase family protein [Ruegeria sp.]|uniref:2OG-Fe(II) oxygenase family protein n=1 Tax=Ruegeria sp. TaxID=1879320 RepID=UPI003B5CAAC4